jgi:DNA-3-methyladenine glycosylase II
MDIANKTTLTQAAMHLQKYDPILRPVIDQYGLCTITPHHDYYRELVESIIGQQLSVKAAASIRRKFLDLFGGVFPEPTAILGKPPDELRAVGLSWAKVAYISDLAKHVHNSTVRFDHLDTLSNNTIIKELTAVKGVGEWTAHMFMMFCMGRLDVLPTGDLGIKNGVRALYGLADTPTAAQITETAIANHWHPYESVACWYVWAALDNKP